MRGGSREAVERPWTLLGREGGEKGRVRVNPDALLPEGKPLCRKVDIEEVDVRPTGEGE